VRETRRYSVYPSNLDIAAAFGRLRDHFQASKYSEDASACENVRYTVDWADSRSLETRSYDEFLKILAQGTRPEKVVAHSHWDTRSIGDLGCIIGVNPGSLNVVVESSDLNLLAGTHDIVRQLFEATNPPRDRPQFLRRWDLKKSVFLAHRFDDQGTRDAHTLEMFLIRLGFEVLEGAGYEARDIPPKVAERIKRQDIFLCLVTPGNQSWILSEASYAKALGRYVILLLEDGLDFDKGILGNDFEHITFPSGFVEKAFSDLMYALP